jgi:hypothetical protein
MLAKATFHQMALGIRSYLLACANRNTFFSSRPLGGGLLSYRLAEGCFRLDDGLIRKSSSFFPDRSFAVNQRGRLPRPAQVSEGLSGFRYLGRTRG